jgi:hypothetical protein
LVILGAAVCLFFVSKLRAAEYAVQIGAFKDPQYAADLAKTAGSLGFQTLPFLPQPLPGELVKVLSGPYRNPAEAEAARRGLAAKGINGFVRPIPESTGTRAVVAEAAPEAVLHADAAPRMDPTAAGQSPDTAVSSDAPNPPARPFRFSGYLQSDTAYTFAGPDHWSHFRHTAEVALEKQLADQINFKISGRFFYDAIYDVTTYFPDRVKSDARFDAMFRETYLNVGAGDWDFRFGRQQIIWGEVVGLFFGDVVSARELRDYLIPDLDYIRIPQWAARAEYFKNDFHAEAIWIPYMTYDRIGKFGSDFFPITRPPAGFAMNIRSERTPHAGLSDSAGGVRAGYLLNGWDLAAFYYNSMDAAPTFFREVINAPVPTVVYTPDHDRIQQAGSTVSKDFGPFVLRGEAVYTWGRWFNVKDLSDRNGVVRQDFLDYIISGDIPLPSESRLNLQFFQRWFPHHDPNIIQRRVETGASLFASTKLLDGKIEPDLQLIHSLNRLDWMIRPRISWRFHPDWRLRVGTAVFGGDKDGLFGRFGNRDRAFVELRYAF